MCNVECTITNAHDSVVEPNFAPGVVEVMVATAEQLREAPRSLRPPRGTIDAAAAGDQRAIRRLWSAIRRAKQRGAAKPARHSPTVVPRSTKRPRGRSRAAHRVGTARPSPQKPANSDEPPPPTDARGVRAIQARRGLP